MLRRDKMKYIAPVLTIFLVLVTFPIYAQIQGQPPSGPAQGQPPQRGFTIPNPLQAQSLTDLLNKIIDFLIVIAAPILVIMVLWAGFLYLTSGGDPTKVQTANKTLMWAAVGFAIILISKGFTLLISNILGGGP